MSFGITERSVLPTPTYFYGMETEDEIFVDIEKGKTLVIRCLAIGDTDEKGMVTVFFELNGQPRRVKVPDRAHGASASPGASTATAARSSRWIGRRCARRSACSAATACRRWRSAS